MNPETLQAFYRLHQKHITPYGILSLDPPIFLVMPVLDHAEHFFMAYGRLFTALAGRPCYCLCNFGWEISDGTDDYLARLEARAGTEFPDVRLIYLCNEPGDVSRFRARGRRAILCNHNCLLDESLFTPIPGAIRTYDAVYDARLVAWKRHDLARKVERLALLYRVIPGDDPDFPVRLREEFRDAHFFNHERGAYRMLTPEETNRALNACRVGLCLSAAEGAMYASAQYLLAGLPVVTTPSRGGRDQFFDDAFVATVPEDPLAVRDAVLTLGARRMAPDAIREATLERIRAHRARLVDLVQEIYQEQGVARDFAVEWPQVFRHKLEQTDQSHDWTLARIRGAVDG